MVRLRSIEIDTETAKEYPHSDWSRLHFDTSHLSELTPLARESHLIQCKLRSVYVTRSSLGKVSVLLHALVNSQSKMNVQYHLEKKSRKI